MIAVLAGQASGFVQPLTLRTIVQPAARLAPMMTAAAAAAEPEPALLTLLEETRLREFAARVFAEPKGVLPLLQDAGIYGVVAYLCAAVLFYATAVPLAEVGYHTVSGNWLEPVWRTRPIWLARAVQATDCLRLAGAWGRLRRDVAPTEASGEPAGREASPVILASRFDPRALLVEDGAEGKAEALVLAGSFYLACKPLAPLRLGGALLLTPGVKRIAQATPLLQAALEGISDAVGQVATAVGTAGKGVYRVVAPRCARKDELLYPYPYPYPYPTPTPNQVRAQGRAARAVCQGGGGRRPAGRGGAGPIRRASAARAARPQPHAATDPVLAVHGHVGVSLDRREGAQLRQP